MLFGRDVHCHRIYCVCRGEILHAPHCQQRLLRVHMPTPQPLVSRFPVRLRGSLKGNVTFPSPDRPPCDGSLPAEQHATGRNRVRLFLGGGMSIMMAGSRGF